MGSAVISQYPYPLVGCRFRSLCHVLAHVPSSGSYIRGRVGKLLFTSFLATAAATIVADLAPFGASAYPPCATPRCASRLARRRTRWARTPLRTPRPAGCHLFSSRRIWRKPKPMASSPLMIRSLSRALSASQAPERLSGDVL
jgi:hypothetical protein